MDDSAKATLNVPGFPVRVLGGTFLVRAIRVGEQEGRDEVLTRIHRTEPDRWFVMVADNTDDEEDTLALVDERLEVQICAHGVLRQD